MTDGRGRRGVYHSVEEEELSLGLPMDLLFNPSCSGGLCIRKETYSILHTANMQVFRYRERLVVVDDRNVEATLADALTASPLRLIRSDD